MASIGEPLVNELREEAATTKRVLERVPGDKLSWRPHAKSMTLGQLALHVATIPGNLARMAQLDEFDASQANFEPPAPRDLAEIHAALEQSLKDAENCIGNMSEESAMGHWRLTMKEKTMLTMPRRAVLRSLMLNHWYHHRGQLSVYLRLLDVPVPVIYGRSADENPFV
jgi:uncharacterized damage-inducible protein DinB